MAIPLDIYNDLPEIKQRIVQSYVLSHLRNIVITSKELHNELDFLCPIVFDDYTISLHSIEVLKRILNY